MHCICIPYFFNTVFFSLSREALVRDRYSYEAGPGGRPQASPGAAALHPAGGCELSWGTQRRQGFSAVPREAAAPPSRPPGGAQRAARGAGGARVGLDACGLQAGRARSAARARPPPRRPRSALVLGARASSLRVRAPDGHKYFSRHAADRGPQWIAGPRGGPQRQLLWFSSGAVSRPRTRVACDRFELFGSAQSS